MKSIANSLWFKFISALAVCLLAAIISNYLTPVKSDAYSRVTVRSDGPAVKEGGSEPTAQTLWEFFFSSGENTKKAILTPDQIPINSLTPMFRLPTLTLTATKGITPASGIAGYNDGVMFYFPTDEGEVPTATEAWQVIYYTDLPTQTLAPTLTPKNTFTPKPTSTPKITKTPTNTLTITPTLTQTPTPTVTASPTNTQTPTPTWTATLTATPTITEVSPTITPSETSIPYDGSFAYINQPGQGDPLEVFLYDLSNQTSQILSGFEDVTLCNWNQDGSELLVRSRRNGSNSFDLIALNISGEQRVLTSALAGSSECGDWLTDSSLLFPYTDETGVSSILQFDIESGLTTPIYQDESQKSELDLSPDQQWAVFISADGEKREVALLDVANGNVSFLTDNDFAEGSPRFAPDGQMILFSRNENETWKILGYDLVSNSETEFGIGRWPDLSSDGKSYLFSTEVNDVEKVFVGRVDQAQRILPVISEGAQTEPLWQPR